MSWSTQLEPQTDDWYVLCYEYYHDMTDQEIEHKYQDVFCVEDYEVPSIPDAINELVDFAYWERTFV
mgnify:CR=1 FL=1